LDRLENHSNQPKEKLGVMTASCKKQIVIFQTNLGICVYEDFIVIHTYRLNREVKIDDERGDRYPSGNAKDEVELQMVGGRAAMPQGRRTMGDQKRPPVRSPFSERCSCHA